MNPIELQGVGKRFSKVEDIAALRVLTRSRRSDLWALRGVDLTVRQGESIGILGRNGAGKTTLLSLLAGLTAPSEGHLAVRGRIAPLIGVGVGFHPELTGRENVHLNASVLGMSNNDIARRFDEIVDFSGIEEFIDAPAKTYSSGMYVRLGFSVAVCATPDILLIDEVLAVGDVEFSRRCFDRLADMRLQGTTIVAVSHNLTVMQVFCERGLVMDGGQVLADTSIAEAVGAYVNLVDEPLEQTVEGGVALQLLDVRGKPATNLRAQETVVLRVSARRPPLEAAPLVRLAMRNERFLVWERLLTWDELGGGEAVDADVSLTLGVVSGTYSMTAEVEAADGTSVATVEAGLHITTSRVVHGSVDLHARLVT